MIVLRKKLTYDNPHNQNLKSVELEKLDYGISFADLLGECEVEGHVTRKYGIEIYNNPLATKREYIERCEICGLERDMTEYSGISTIGDNGLQKYVKQPTKYGEWRQNKCWECDEGCEINKSLYNIGCPICGSDTVDDLEGGYHTGENNMILYDCAICGNKDQIIE